MSLESIEQGIRKSVETLKSSFKSDIDVKKQEKTALFEQEYQTAYSKAKNLLEKHAEERYMDSLLQSKMTQKNLVLSHKKELVQKILDKVQFNLSSLLGDTRYYNFILTYIKKYAQNGDVVYLSSQDIRLADKLSADSGINARFVSSDEVDAGLIIEKEHFNYNFSSSALIMEHYSEIENILGRKIYEN